VKTLLIHQAFASPQDAGGTRHYEFARHLIRQGDQFVIVASDIHYPSGIRLVERTKLVTKQNLDGIGLLRSYTYPSVNRGFVWRVIAFVSFMITSVYAALRAGPVDLVMGTSPPIFQAVSAWFVALVRRRPFLLEIRDLWPEFAIDIGILKNPLAIAASRWLERFLYARATHLLVNSPAYRDYLINKGVAATKITLIPNGVDTDMFDPHASAPHLRAELHLDGKFVVTYAGALGLANDLDTILRAAERLCAESAVHFLMVGDGKERPNLEAKARMLGLSNVTFAGSYPKNRIPEILAASQACVACLKNIPMFRTTYPNKVFDYMAAGRPTLLVIDGVIREVIEAAQGGIFVPPGDDAALARGVMELSGDPQLAQTMGQNARAYVVEHFNRAQQAQDFYHLVHRLADVQWEA
jgi:glycosyltransferase involved in cell wall biosynthesis